MRYLAGLFLLVYFSVCSGVYVEAQSPNQQGFEIMKNLDIYSNLIKELNQDYVDEINPGELTQKGIDAMLESLDQTRTKHLAPSWNSI